MFASESPKALNWPINIVSGVKTHNESAYFMNFNFRQSPHFKRCVTIREWVETKRKYLIIINKRQTACHTIGYCV